MQEDIENIEKVFNGQIYELGRRIGELDAFKEEVKLLSKFFHEFSEVFDHLIESNNKDELGKKLSTIEQNVVSYQDSFRSFCSTYETKHQFQDRRIDAVERFQNNHHALEARFSESEKKRDALSSRIEQSESLHNKHKSDIQSLNYSLGKYSQDLSVIVDETLFLKDIGTLVRADIQNLYKFKVEICKLTDQLRQDLEAKIATIHSELEGKISSSANLLDKKISSIQMPDVSGFSLKSSLDELDHKVYLSDINAKNAFLKASNCANQVAVLEKKLENISLNLQSQELTK